MRGRTAGGVMNHSCEAVVVGAGPAGCCAAVHLKRAGVDVLLLDKAVFPRDKVCGDGVPGKVFSMLNEIGLPLETVRRQGIPIRRLSVQAPGGETITAKSGDSSSGGVCIERKNFDALLLQRATECLDRVWTGLQVVGSVRVPGHAHALTVRDVRTGEMCTIGARAIIGADGVHSTIARCYGMVPRDHAASLFGIRMYCQGGRLDPGAHILYDARLLPGYAWFFPVSATRVNAGLIVTPDMARQQGRRLPELLRQIVVSHCAPDESTLPPDLRGPLQGWPLPVAANRVARVSDGVLLAGDAGAFVNGLTGGGIYNALLTGRLAARVASESLRKGDTRHSQLHRYDCLWQRELGGSFQCARQMRKLFSNATTINRLVRGCAGNRAIARLFFAVYGNPLPRFGLCNPLFLFRVLAG